MSIDILHEKPCNSMKNFGNVYFKSKNFSAIFAKGLSVLGTLLLQPIDLRHCYLGEHLC